MKTIGEQAKDLQDSFERGDDERDILRRIIDLRTAITEREAAANAAGVVRPCFKATNFVEVVK